MKRIVQWLRSFASVLVAVSLSMPPGWAQDAPPPLTRSMIVEALRQKSFSADGLASYIRSCKVDFRLDADARRELEAAGASAEVLEVLRRSFHLPDPEPAPQPVDTVVAVPADVQQARLIHQVSIVQTPQARAAQLQLEQAHGQVRLAIEIDKDGAVDKVKPLSGQPVLAEIAAEAVRQWKYKPALQDGNPVRVTTELAISFADHSLVAPGPSRPAAEAAKARAAEQPRATQAPAAEGGVTYAADGDAAQLIVAPKAPFELHREMLKDPDRLVLDFLGEGELIGGRIPRSLPIDDPAVRLLRVGLPKPGTTRVVLELQPGTTFDVQRLDAPDRVQVTLRNAALKTDAPVPPMPAASAPRHRIILDAGHGGKDTGAISAGGLMEKDLALDITLRLGRELSERLGQTVVFTRDSDSFVSLADRARIANAHAPDLLLSVHANAEPTRTVAGFEAFVGGAGLAPVERQSRALATYVHAALQMVHPSGTRTPVKTAPFIVLAEASMPAALAEVGFLSNSADETFLTAEASRDRIVHALYTAIAGYLSSLERTQLAKN